MAKRGIRRHQKRLSAPKHWMLSKVGGIWATKPNQGPHKLRESLPLVVLLRNKLKLALTGREAKIIVNDKQGNIAIDGKVRRDPKYPVGFMDVITLLKSRTNYRLLYDVKGKFKLVKINQEECQYKLCKVINRKMGDKNIPQITTNDGRTIRFPHPDIKANDTIKLNLKTNEIVKHFKYAVGNKVIIIGGNNIGRVGVIDHVEKHPGSYEIVHIKDEVYCQLEAQRRKDDKFVIKKEDEDNHCFSTRLCNIFVIGEKDSEITLLKNHIRHTILEEREYKGIKGIADDEENQEE